MLRVLFFLSAAGSSRFERLTVRHEPLIKFCLKPGFSFPD
jgi:hypothetical protein